MYAILLDVKTGLLHLAYGKLVHTPVHMLSVLENFHVLQTLGTKIVLSDGYFITGT